MDHRFKDFLEGVKLIQFKEPLAETLGVFQGIEDIMEEIRLKEEYE